MVVYVMGGLFAMVAEIPQPMRASISGTMLVLYLGQNRIFIGLFFDFDITALNTPG
jgi:hypothetical protein